MNLQTKRILLIAGFILLIIGVIIAIWFLFFAPLFRKPSLTNGNANTNTNGSGKLPNINTNRKANTNQPFARGENQLPQPSVIANGDLTLVTSVTNDPAMSPTQAPDGKNLQYYNESDGKFYRIDPSTGKATALSDQRFPSATSVVWAPDNNKVALAFPDNSKVVYDFQAKKQYTLPAQAEQVSFAPNSQQIAYAYLGGTDSNVLVTSDFTGAQAKVVQEIGDKAAQVQVAWSPSNEVVGMYHHTVDSGVQEVVMIGQNEENLKNLTVEGQGFVGKWTPDGNKLLYTVNSAATDWNPELFLVYAKGDAIGAGKMDLNISTFIDKCAFDHAGTHAYCAVPDALPSGSGLYPSFASSVKYTFSSIDLATGSSRTIAQPVDANYTRYTVGSVFVSDDGSALYFTSVPDNALHKIRLK